MAACAPGMGYGVLRQGWGGGVRVSGGCAAAPSVLQGGWGEGFRVCGVQGSGVQGVRRRRGAFWRWWVGTSAIQTPRCQLHSSIFEWFQVMFQEQDRSRSSGPRVLRGGGMQRGGNVNACRCTMSKQQALTDSGMA